MSVKWIAVCQNSYRFIFTKCQLEGSDFGVVANVSKFCYSLNNCYTENVSDRQLLPTSQFSECTVWHLPGFRVSSKGKLCEMENPGDMYYLRILNTYALTTKWFIDFYL